METSSGDVESHLDLLNFFSFPLCLLRASWNNLCMPPEGRCGTSKARGNFQALVRPWKTHMRKSCFFNFSV